MPVFFLLSISYCRALYREVGAASDDDDCLTDANLFSLYDFIAYAIGIVCRDFLDLIKHFVAIKTGTDMMIP